LFLLRDVGLGKKHVATAYQIQFLISLSQENQIYDCTSSMFEEAEEATSKCFKRGQCGEETFSHMKRYFVASRTLISEVKSDVRMWVQSLNRMHSPHEVCHGQRKGFGIFEFARSTHQFSNTLES